MSASSEQFATVSTGMKICYQTFGDPSDEPLLLVMGLGGPMTWWNEDLCGMLARAGFFVIRYDNRDVGRSGRGKGLVARRDLVRAFLGRPVQAPYSLEEMSRDGLGLLDHLGIESAHVCGMSMGGMIAQTIALLEPARVRSLVSIMSTTGSRRVGFQHPRVLPVLLGRAGAGRDAYVANSTRVWRVIESPGYPMTDEEIRTRAGETFDRGVSASGVLRQMMAVITQPDRTSSLRRLDIPAAVIHGRRDRMVHPSGGKATARAIPGCELVLVPDMGHDAPRELFQDFVDVIRRTADRAADRAADRGSAES